MPRIEFSDAQKESKKVTELKVNDLLSCVNKFAEVHSVKVRNKTTKVGYIAYYRMGVPQVMFFHFDNTETVRIKKV